MGAEGLTCFAIKEGKKEVKEGRKEEVTTAAAEEFDAKLC